ncbi:DUF2316 family protein [Streptococcus panodentis]|uniref:DUF2316 domain-containing protein n=1 Tax=Streptococcus panodentis TaxID=1581472 RepID=A0ABS5ATS7_9STRE|nr:DUF2316 family protein [Streptococcus sp. DD11]KXT85735.1 hypothetical protein STRDD11_00227 [Streptococcus sp. DD11]MBP2619978.1 DUF2316 domain-containing protein [Streptococcus panodentis]
MLNRSERQHTAAELQENYRRLGYPEERVRADLGLSAKELAAVLDMQGPDPAHVWMLRDYLEDMLIREGRPVYPFSKLANPSVNRWYRYDRPWRKESAQ